MGLRRATNAVDEAMPTRYPIIRRRRRRPRHRRSLAANVERSIITIIVAAAAAEVTTNHLEDREVDPTVRSRTKVMILEGSMFTWPIVN